MSIIEALVVFIIFGIAIKGFASYKLACANEINIEKNESYMLENTVTWIILIVPIIIIGIVLLLHYN